MNKADASFVNTKKKVQNKGVAMNGMEENLLATTRIYRNDMECMHAIRESKV